MSIFKNLALYGTKDLVANAIIYMVLAGSFFTVFWVIFKKKFQNRRIQPNRRKQSASVKSEIINSLIALLVFTVVDILIYVAQLKGYTRIYTNINQYGWVYLIFSVAAMILMHDAWFYFTHRLMHHPILYRHVHRVHHQSTDTSPFTGLSMHPFEVLMDAGIFVVFAFLFPVHMVALWAWQLIHMTLNVIGHLGYEIYPKGFNRHWLFKLKTTSTHHNMHHERSAGNYGFYFTWWDKIFNTEFKNYHDVYDAIHERADKAESANNAPTNSRLRSLYVSDNRLNPITKKAS